MRMRARSIKSGESRTVPVLGPKLEDGKLTVGEGHASDVGWIAQVIFELREGDLIEEVGVFHGPCCSAAVQTIEVYVLFCRQSILLLRVIMKTGSVVGPSCS